MKGKPLARLAPFLGLVVLCSFLSFVALHFVPGGPLAGRNQTGDRKSRFSEVDKLRLQAYLGIAESGSPAVAPAEPSESAPAVPRADGLLATTAFRTDRLVLKNGHLHVLVKDVDQVTDLATRLTLDYGGYVINSRIWSETWEGKAYQHATLTLAVPSESFEVVIRRLRGFAVDVVDESTSGEDATDEYVDLESRLRSLEATRDRIRSFLDRAQNAEEALMVNEDLSGVETQIEEIKGRMNYLSQRGSYATIQVRIDEQIAPEPTPTPLSPWAPGETVTHAGRTLGTILRRLGNFGIWLGIVVVPLVIPAGALAGGVWRVLKRRDIV